MPRRPLGYLHQNRHGGFTFRWRPPLDVAGHFAQLAFEFSLATKSRAQAWQRALPATMRVNRLVSMLRAMRSSSNPKEPILKTKLIRFLVLPDGIEHKVDYNPGDPTEVAEANRVFDELVKGVAGGSGRSPTLRRNSNSVDLVGRASNAARRPDDQQRVCRLLRREEPVQRLEGPRARRTLRFRPDHHRVNRCGGRPADCWALRGAPAYV